MPKPKLKPLKWAVRSHRNLLQIQKYYVKNAGDRIADEAVDAIYYQTEKIAERPMLYRKGSHEGVHECVMSRFPFIIYYRVSAVVIEIVKIVHQRAKR